MIKKILCGRCSWRVEREKRGENGEGGEDAVSAGVRGGIGE